MCVCVCRREGCGESSTNTPHNVKFAVLIKKGGREGGRLERKKGKERC